MKAAALVFAVLGVFVFAPVPAADAAVAGAKKPYSLKGTSYLPQRRKVYSVRKSDTFDTRKFNDPALGRQAQGEPFDNGFFFETPRGQFGGYTPYMH